MRVSTVRTQRRGDFLASRSVDVGEHDARAFPGKGGSDTPPDPGCGAGYECCVTSKQLSFHGGFPCDGGTGNVPQSSQRY